jgi:hypothetical protein
MSTSSQYYRVTARVGVPHRYEVDVTVPLVGPAGATGATGASTWNEISGKPATFPPSAHEHQPDQVYADAAFVSQSGDSSLQIGIYLHNGTDNGRPVYESPTTGDYIWWDSNLDQWYLTSNTDVNLYYLDENADQFPWETDVVWNAIPPQTGNIEVDQAFLSDISDYGVASVIGLKTSKSGNASSTELVLGSDTRLTNSRTPSSTLAHAASHHTGGSDALAPANIGAAAAVHTHTTADITGLGTAATEDFASPPAIGNTTPNSGAFTSLSANNGTLTASAPVLDLSQTWNNAGVTFTGLQLNVTNTASAAASRLLRIQRDGTDCFSILPTGGIQLNHSNNTVGINLQENWQALHISVGSTTFGSGSTTAMRLYGAGTGSSRIQFFTNSGLQIMASNNLASGAAGTYVIADGDDTLAQRRATNPQTFRLYTTYGGTGGADFERLFIKGQTVGAFQIGTEKGGTGGARALEFQTDGVTRVTLGDAGGITVNSGNLVLTDNTGAETATFDAQAKLTANRTYDLPDSSGTIALLETLPAGGPTNLWIPASAWIPKTTAGCGVDSRETATNDQNFDELLFDTGADELADALVIMPSNYNNGTVTARFYWTAASGSGGVVWAIQGRAFANDDALDTAAGTAQLVTDTLIAADDMHVTSATSAVTLGGTPAANTPIQFTIYRDVSDAGDDLGVDARLLGVEIIYTAA